MSPCGEVQAVSAGFLSWKSYFGAKFWAPSLDVLGPLRSPSQNLHKEMLKEPHPCLLQKYTLLQTPWSVPTLSFVDEKGQGRAWDSFDSKTIMTFPGFSSDQPSIQSAPVLSCLCLLPSIFHQGTRAACSVQEQQGFRGQTQKLLDLEVMSAAPRLETEFNSKTWPCSLSSQGIPYCGFFRKTQDPHISRWPEKNKQ